MTRLLYPPHREAHCKLLSYAVTLLNGCASTRGPLPQHPMVTSGANSEFGSVRLVPFYGKR
ncbi:hypothetical protein JB92DRAFT_2909203 [Gautieria morchelliformis]|nr:hypothetical protein JB92DRAFT_2909203 [Gautieria morchelliformis]